ncbi:ankyrin repeat domain-containing protein [Desulfococcaceae bacterium HSG8]|nr:ankyrin repeat domain-containing protein [Desulfococcaceae bacterium HSG8]
MKTNDEITEILLDAIETGDMKAVTKIADSGVSVNARDFLGRTALFVAVSTGNHNFVRFLITRGADVNIPEVNGITPLMEAASAGDAETVNLLLENGADILITDNFEDTAYDYAVSQGFPEIGELLSVKTEPRIPGNTSPDSGTNSGKREFLVPVDEVLAGRLTEIAESKQIRPETLIELWLKEKISESYQQA